MSKPCPRCNSADVAFEQRTTVDRWRCQQCGWTWFGWGTSGKKLSALRAVIGLPQSYDPTRRWCECVVRQTYRVEGTLGERVTYCWTCRKYVDIWCPAGLKHGGHWRALQANRAESEVGVA